MQAQARGEAVEFHIVIPTVIAVPCQAGLLVQLDLLPVLGDDGHLAVEVLLRELFVQIAVVEDRVGADFRLRDRLQERPTEDESVGVGTGGRRGRRGEIIFQDRMMVTQVQLGFRRDCREEAQREGGQGGTSDRIK